MTELTIHHSEQQVTQETTNFDNVLAVLCPLDRSGSMVLQGVFGQVVSIDVENREVEIRLDEQLVNCSAIFTPYSGGATFKTGFDEAIIVHNDNPAVLDSVRASLAASLADNWGARYENLMMGARANSFLRQALQLEMDQAIQGVKALINSKNVQMDQLPMGKFVMLDENTEPEYDDEYDNFFSIKELVLLKAPLVANIDQEAYSPSRVSELNHSEYLDAQNIGMKVLLKEGLDPMEFAQVLAEDKELFSLFNSQMTLEYAQTLIPMTYSDALQVLEEQNLSKVNELFHERLVEKATVQANEQVLNYPSQPQES